MAGKVWLLPVGGMEDAMGRRLGELYDAAGLAAAVAARDLVALKMHFGERGSVRTIHPAFVRAAADKVRAAGGSPFVTDANTLYRGKRKNAPDHLVTAHHNGYSYSSLGAPLVIADGLNGQSFVSVDFPAGKHCKQVKLAAELYRAGSFLVLTHATGHILFGLGGALKNLGMGAGSSGGKQMMHSGVKPTVDQAKCEGDFACARHCPAGAVRRVGEKKDKAEIDHNRCIGCGECAAVCPAGAIAVRWGEPGDCQERTVDYAAAMMAGRKEKFAFITFVIAVTPECDCMAGSGKPFVPDQGILAGTDPVALDQAAADLINRAPLVPGRPLKAPDQEGKDNLRAVTGNDWQGQLKAAESLGLGTRDYQLVTL